MLFNSFSFAVFLPIVFIIYWIIPHKFRWILMLIASYYFYMSWNAKYVVLIFFTTFISYIAAIIIEKSNNKKYKRITLSLCAMLCLGVLFFFKYFNFMSKSILNILGLFSIQLNPITIQFLLPVGISFYTFQTLSYVIDVYKGDVSAEKHWGYYATFISFFPQLVAGPIERTINLLPQIKAKHNFDYNQATYGLKLMAWGLFKKIVLADTLSNYVSTVYNSPNNYSGFALVIGTIFFTINIYCDFSGYSDIAIGTAKLFGINLMSNFKSPYFSHSVKEFWNRWHISLSTWFRDYIYIPLGGNRVGKIRHTINLMITFLTSGLWHGANWTYVMWGGIHGIAQSIENIIYSSKQEENSRIISCIKTVFVFIFVSFAWIFFVSHTLEDAIYVITHCFHGISSPLSYLTKGLIDIELKVVDLALLFPSIFLLFLYDYFSLKTDVISKISSKATIFRWSIYILFVLWTIINIPSNNDTRFVYFQF